MKNKMKGFIAVILSVIMIMQLLPYRAEASGGYSVGIKEISGENVTAADIDSAVTCGFSDIAWGPDETEKNILFAVSWDVFPDEFEFDTYKFLKYVPLVSGDTTFKVIYRPDGWSYDIGLLKVRIKGADNGAGKAYMLIKLYRGEGGVSPDALLNRSGLSLSDASLVTSDASEKETENVNNSQPNGDGVVNGDNGNVSDDSIVPVEPDINTGETEISTISNNSEDNGIDNSNAVQTPEVNAVSGTDAKSDDESLLTEPSAKSEQNVSATPLRAGENEAETYNIIINYVFADQTIAAEPFVLTLDAGESCNETVPNPVLVGYDPYVGLDEFSSSSVTLSYTNIQENKLITVTYLPAQVQYRVRHYLQNADNDDYTMADEDILVGTTGETVGKVEKDTYEGFYPLLYIHPTIAADGSTVVDVYYDRYYFLMYFDLQGGKGVDPIYARYGANIGNVANPTREGYAFAGWDTPVPTTVPLGNKTYTASWSPRETTYRVIYWYENVSDNSYSIMDTKTLYATTGTVVNSASYANDSFSGNDTAHFTHDASKDESYTVSGDGMTNVNVYYSRNIVTFNFTYINGDRLTMQGKYESTFAENGYAWPPSTNGYMWQYGSTGMSYMTAFLPPSGQGLTVNFTERTASSGNRNLYFYPQNVDGSYNTDTIEGSDTSFSTNNNFTLTNKYAGFELKDYRKQETTMRTVWRIGSTTGPEYSGSDFYIPQSGTPNSTTTYYGLVNGSIVRLSNGNYYSYGNGTRYTGAYKYAQQSGSSTSSTYYGVVNGEVVYPVSYGYIWTYDGEPYDGQRYTSTTSTSSGTIYYVPSGGELTKVYYSSRYWYTEEGTVTDGYGDNFTVNSNTTYYTEDGDQLYYRDGQLCERSGGWFGYDYDPFTGSVFTRGPRNGAAPSPRYQASNGTSGNTTYYGFIDGQMRQLSRTQTWRYNGAQYTGNLYTQTDASNFPNDSVQYYGFVAGAMTPITAHTGILLYNGIEYTDTFYTVQTNPGTSGGPYYVPYNGEMVRAYPVQEESDWGAWIPAVDGTTQITQNGNYQIRFERQPYTLRFYNYDDYINSRQTMVRYSAPLAQYDFMPPYPDSLPWAAYQFTGWYDNQELVGVPFDFSTAKMPMNNLTLFAKWEPIEFNVRVFLDLPSAEAGTSPLSSSTVFYGQLAPVPVEPERPEMQFIGWFYKDARTGAEIPFNFSATVITQDTDVYAKWTSSVLRNYEFHFETEDGREVAAPIYSSGLMGSTKTVQAKDVLYPEFSVGWFPKVKSHSILIQDSEEYNVFTFEYVYRTNVPYTVNYLDARTSAPLAPPKVVSENAMILVSEKYLPISGYIPDAYRKSLVVSVFDESQNAINFYYTADSQHAYYATSHYIETSPGVWRLYNELDAIGNIGDTVTAEPMAIPGYTLDTSVAGTVQSGTVTHDGLEMTLYYKPNEYPYYVRYLEYRTETVLAPEKTGSGLYQRNVTENAIEILGYDLVSNSPQTIEILEDPNGSLRKNVMTFYYRVQQATFTYNVVPADGGSVSKSVEHVSVRAGLLDGSTVTPNPGWELVGWYKDSACTIPVSSADAVISGENGETILPLKNTSTNLFESKNFYAKMRRTVGTLEIDMRIEGPMGVKTDVFDYTLNLVSENGNAYNGTIEVQVNGGNVQTSNVINGNYNFRMTDSDDILFTLPAGYTYTVTQHNNTGREYTETPTSITGEVVYTGTTGSFVNSLPIVAPNDVHMRTAPFTWMFLIPILAYGIILINQKTEKRKERNR